MQEEIWKDVVGYENEYLISNLGRVKSLDKRVKCKNNNFRTSKGKIIKQRKDPEGRLYVTLSSKCFRKSFKVHRLVAYAFLNHKPSGYSIIIDHINNDRSDNTLENLQLITPRENVSKDRKNKSSKYTGVWFCNTTKKWKSEIKINKKRFNLGYFSIEEDARDAYIEKLTQNSNNG